MNSIPEKIDFTPWGEEKLEKNMYTISVTKGGVTLIATSLLNRLGSSIAGSVDFFFDTASMTIGFRFYPDRRGKYGILENHGSYKISTATFFDKLMVDVSVVKRYYLTSHEDIVYFTPDLVDPAMAKARWRTLKEVR